MQAQAVDEDDQVRFGVRQGCAQALGVDGQGLAIAAELHAQVPETLLAGKKVAEGAVDAADCQQLPAAEALVFAWQGEPGKNFIQRPACPLCGTQNNAVHLLRDEALQSADNARIRQGIQDGKVGAADGVGAADDAIFKGLQGATVEFGLVGRHGLGLLGGVLN
jgi:hypothetical protein